MATLKPPPEQDPSYYFWGMMKRGKNSIDLKRAVWRHPL